jgi:hypothetical protein
VGVGVRPRETPREAGVKLASLTAKPALYGPVIIWLLITFGYAFKGVIVVNIQKVVLNYHLRQLIQ